MTDPNLTQGTDSGGRYDEEATLVRERTNAAMALVVVLGGDNGIGFSVQAIDPTLLLLLPKLLRSVAGHIERQQHGQTH